MKLVSKITGRNCEYRQTKRGSKGVKALNITDKNGDMASFKIVSEDQDVVIVTDTGMIIRIPLDQVNTLGRVTQGVRLMNLKEGQTISTMSLIEKNKDENSDEANDNNIVTESENTEITENSNNEEVE